MTRELGLICALFTTMGCSNSFDGTGNEPGKNSPVNSNLTDDDGDGYTEDNGDCDDTLPEVNPGEKEVPYDGLDNDCKKSTRDDDLDKDGYGIDEDCDDENKAVHPKRDEKPYNGLDDDCDESTPDDDLDGDGYLKEDDCDDTDYDIHPDAEELTDNGEDDDCDGATDERFDTEIIDDSCDCGESSSIAVDSTGAAHVVYANADDGTILYKYRNTEGEWSASRIIVESAGWAGEHLDLSVDDNDSLHLAFTILSENEANRDLYYMYANEMGMWSSIYMGAGGTSSQINDNETRSPSDVGWYVDIEVDSTNSPVFAYMDNLRGVPVVSTFSQNGDVDSLDQDYNFTGATGEYVSLALDSHDGVHTIYHNDGFMNDVRYTNWNSLTFSEVVDPRPGLFTSIAMAEINVPCMSFYDDSKQDLIYGCRENNKWTNQQVLRDGNVGEYSQLLFNDRSVPNILFYDGNTDSLRMVQKPSIGGWKEVEVDTAPGTGAYLSATVGPKDAIYITYYDQATGALKFATGQ